MYAAGNSAARDPVERHLKYYQVLEFYMTKAADSIAASQGVTVERATSPLQRPTPNNRLGSEQNTLTRRTCLPECTCGYHLATVLRTAREHALTCIIAADAACFGMHSADIESQHFATTSLEGPGPGEVR
jgi:hypothetical protein